MFSDEALRLAAANSLAAFTETAERDYDPELPWEPSETFLRKLRRLTRRADHPVIYHTMRTAAAVFLAILTMATAWLSADQRAQAAFIAWVRNLYENSVIYDFFGPAQQAALPEYDFLPVPEGYEETMFLNDGFSHVRMYEDGNGGMIVLSYHALSEDVVSGFFGETLSVERVRIGHCEGNFYVSANPTDTNELIWIDEQKGTVFYISGFLEKEEMLLLTETVTKK